MPCFRCRTRQTDPARGVSPWKRAVVEGEQVLFCPPCQQAAGWSEALDRCGRCGSANLAKALGAVSCRDCGREIPPDPSGADLTLSVGGVRRQPIPATSGLSAEVEAALARVLGRSLR